MYEKKQLLLVMRHAKSDRSLASLDDYDRPLNDRGQLQPAIIAAHLNKLKITLDRVVVSPAVRTRQTWLLLKSALIDPPEATYEPTLYNATDYGFIEALRQHADDCHHLLAIGHCPSVALVVELFTGKYHDFKTADLAILSPKKSTLMDALNQPNSFHCEDVLSADL